MYHTETTISHHNYWPNLRDKICTHIHIFRTCKKNKKQIFKNEISPAKETEAILWDILLVDIIIPYKLEEQVMINPHAKRLN